MRKDQQLAQERKMNKNPYLVNLSKLGYGLQSWPLSCYDHKYHRGDCEACNFVVKRLLEYNNLV